MLEISDRNHTILGTLREELAAIGRDEFQVRVGGTAAEIFGVGLCVSNP